MIITAIEPRRKGLCALYIDGECAVRLDAETVLGHRFDVGREITDEQLRACIADSDLKRCKDKAMWLIGYRDHSRRELIDKLRRDYSAEAAEAAVSRLEELGLLDDGRFARRYAADLVNLKHLSARGVRQKLREKGIDRELIDEVMDELQPDEDAAIREILARRYPDLGDEKIRRRAVAALTRMGYAYGDIKNALSEYIEGE